jgi:hypothetical protein
LKNSTKNPAGIGRIFFVADFMLCGIISILDVFLFLKITPVK